MKYIFIIILSVFTLQLSAQSVPVPAKEQNNAIILTNATIHIGNGEVIENGSILFENGKIVEVGASVSSSNAVSKDYSGKHIYPGVIAANTVIGLSEVEALRQTRDFNEVGSLNPNVRSIIAYNTDSRVIPTLRSNGVLMAQVAPRGGRIPGTSSIVQFDAWNWEDAAYKTDDGVYLNWPQSYRRTGWWAEPGGYEKDKEYDKNLLELHAYFSQAKAYSENSEIEKNLRFEGMRGLFDGSKNLYISVDEANSIISAVTFAKEYGITPVIVGGATSYMITDFLKENNIPVILDAVHSTPFFEDQAVNMPYQIPSILQKAGIQFCITNRDYWQARNLPYQAGTAVAHGLDKEEGLRAITLSVAEILGIADKTGSLEVGKDATLVVTEGDLLDMYSSNVIDAYIQGREIDLGNKQKDLYKKFSDKYGQEIILP